MKFFRNAGDFSFFFFFFRAALSSERFAKTFPAELSGLSRLVDRCRSRYNDRNIFVLIVNDTCPWKVTRTYRSEKKKINEEKGSKRKAEIPTDWLRTRAALNVEGPGRLRTVDKWTSSTAYKSPEIRLSWNRTACVAAYQFDSRFKVLASASSSSSSSFSAV